MVFDRLQCCLGAVSGEYPLCEVADGGAVHRERYDEPVGHR